MCEKSNCHFSNRNFVRLVNSRLRKIRIAYLANTDLGRNKFIELAFLKCVFPHIACIPAKIIYILQKKTCNVVLKKIVKRLFF